MSRDWNAQGAINTREELEELRRRIALQREEIESTQNRLVVLEVAVDALQKLLAQKENS